MLAPTHLEGWSSFCFFRARLNLVQEADKGARSGLRHACFRWFKQRPAGVSAQINSQPGLPTLSKVRLR